MNMKEKEHAYIAIDLKSFYASVECVERGLDPLTTNLVVADESRSSKTICLAVSPSLKAYGIAGRPELESMPEQVFEDVADSAYYAAPVAWAYTEGITSGTSKTAFSPDAPCKRAQIVTYLYLYFTE